jgi:hypothetical protein
MAQSQIPDLGYFRNIPQLITPDVIEHHWGNLVHLVSHHRFYDLPQSSRELLIHYFGDPREINTPYEVWDPFSESVCELNESRLVSDEGKVINGELWSYKINRSIVRVTPPYLTVGHTATLIPATLYSLQNGDLRRQYANEPLGEISFPGSTLILNPTRMVKLEELFELGWAKDLIDPQDTLPYLLHHIQAKFD